MNLAEHGTTAGLLMRLRDESDCLKLEWAGALYLCDTNHPLTPGYTNLLEGLSELGYITLLSPDSSVSYTVEATEALKHAPEFADAPSDSLWALTLERDAGSEKWSAQWTLLHWQQTLF